MHQPETWHIFTWHPKYVINHFNQNSYITCNLAQRGKSISSSWLPTVLQHFQLLKTPSTSHSSPDILHPVQTNETFAVNWANKSSTYDKCSALPILTIHTVFTHTCFRWRWALVSPDGVAPSRMVSVSASVNLPLHHKVKKFSSGTGSPGWSRKNGQKTVVVWWWWMLFSAAIFRWTSASWLLLDVLHSAVLKENLWGQLVQVFTGWMSSRPTTFLSMPCSVVNLLHKQAINDNICTTQQDRHSFKGLFSKTKW